MAYNKHVVALKARVADLEARLSAARFPRQVGCWTYPKESLDLGHQFKLHDLWDRAVSAQACEHELVLWADQKGIEVNFRKRVV